MKIKKILLLINLILTGLILWVAFHMITSWASTEQGPNKPAGEESVAKTPREGFSQTRKSMKYYQAILDQDVFKTKKVALSTPQNQQKEVKITEMDLTLRGTVVGENEESYAIILDGSANKEELYYLNNFVQGARIVRIMPDRVILNKNGAQEALVLSYESASAPVVVDQKRKYLKRRPVRRPLRQPVRRPKRE